MKKKYTSSDIEVLKGIEPVQKRPGMYTDTSNPNHLVQELIDNSVDEAISGYCNEIIITFHDDNRVSVEDNGRGMPVDPHPEHKVSGVEVIMTNLHSGAKFSEKNYKYSASGKYQDYTTTFSTTQNPKSPKNIKFLIGESLTGNLVKGNFTLENFRNKKYT